MTCLLGLALSAAGCRHIAPVDTAPLDAIGMGYDAIQQLHALQITPAEVAQIAEIRRTGFSDDDCIAVMKIYRRHGAPFDGGDAMTGLAQAGMGDDDILELARLNQLGLDWGELQAMRLAGLSDPIVLEVARHHAEGKPVLAGASLARLKNAGMHNGALLDLVQHGVPDSQAAAILSYRRHGVSDAQIVRHFTGS